MRYGTGGDQPGSAHFSVEMSPAIISLTTKHHKGTSIGIFIANQPDTHGQNGKLIAGERRYSHSYHKTILD